MASTNSFVPASLLRHDLANVVQGENPGLNEDRLVSIRWNVPLGAVDSCMEWLRDERYIFSDTVIEHQAFDGTWRLVSVERGDPSRNREGIDVIATYAYGWITSLVANSAPIYDGSRLINHTQTPDGTAFGAFPSVVAETYPNVNTTNSAQEYLLLRYDGIDPDRCKAIANELRAVSELNWTPVCRGESYGSGWTRLLIIDNVEANPNEKDRSGTIDVLLIKAYKSFQMWSAYGTPEQAKILNFQKVPVSIAQEVCNAYNKRVGASASMSGVDDQGLVDINITDIADADDASLLSDTSCSFWSLTTFYFNQTTPTKVPDNSMGITYSSRWDLIRQTGMWAGFIEKRVRQTLSIAEYRFEDTHSRIGTSYGWDGLWKVGSSFQSAALSWSGSDIVATMTDVALPTDGVLADGQTRATSRERNQDCTYNITVRNFNVTPQTHGDFDIMDDASEHASEGFLLDQASTTTVVLAANSGEALEARINVNRDTNTLDISNITRDAKDQVGSEYAESAAESVAAVIHTQGDAIAAPTETAGTVATRRNRPTRFGKTETQDEVRTAKDQTSNEYAESHSESVSTLKHTQSTSDVAQPNPSAGEIITAAENPTVFGRKQTEVTTRTAKDQLGSEYVESASESVEAVIHTQGTALVAPMEIAGSIFSRRSRPTPFGKAETQDETRTAKDQTATEYEETHAESAVTEKHTQNASSVTAPSPAAGEIIAAQENPTPFGRAQTAVTTRTAKDQTGVDYTESHDESVVATAHTQGEALSSPVETAGEIVSRSNRPTPFGKSATVDQVRTAKNQIVSEYADSADESVVTEKHTQGDELSFTSATTGTIRVISQDKTEFGKTRFASQVRTAKDQTGTDYTESHDESVVATAHTQGDALIAPVETDGEIITRSNRPTAFGKSATVDQVRTAKDQTIMDWAVSHDEIVMTSKHTQGAEVPYVGTSEGFITTVSQDPTPFGKTRSAVQSRHAVDQSDASYEDAHDAASVATIHTQAAALTSATAASGTVVAQRNRPTPFGKHSTEEVVTTAKDQTATDYVDTHAESVEVAKHTQGVDLTAPTAIAGTIVSASQSPTRFGLKQTALETRTAKDQTGSQFEETHAESKTATSHTQGTDLAAPAITAGTIAVRSSRPTPFGRSATEEVVTTAKNQAAYSYEEDAATSSVRLLQTYDDADESAPSWTAGVRVAASNTPTVFGKPRTEVVTVTAKNQTGREYVDTAAETKYIDTDTQETAELADDSFTTGVIIQSASSPTLFGKYNRAKVQRTAKVQTHYLTWTNENGPCFRHWGSNAPLGTAQAIAGIYDPNFYSTSPSATENEFGLEDYTVTAVCTNGTGMVDIPWRTPTYKVAATLETRTIKDETSVDPLVVQSRYVFKMTGDLYAQTLHSTINLRDDWETDTETKAFVGISWPGPAPVSLDFNGAPKTSVVFTPADLLTDNGRALIDMGTTTNACGAKVYTLRGVWVTASDWVE